MERSVLDRFIRGEISPVGIMDKAISLRGHAQDGIKLMRKLGLPWLVSPVPGWELFSVRVAESSMPFLRKYSAKLAETHPLTN